MLFLIIGIVCSFTILLPQEGDGRRMGIGRGGGVGGGGLRLARKWQVKSGTLDDSKPLRKEVLFFKASAMKTLYRVIHGHLFIRSLIEN